MRTNIVIDDELMEQALRVADVTTKREVVDQALREFVGRRSQSWLLDWFGVAPGLDAEDDDDRYRLE